MAYLLIHQRVLGLVGCGARENSIVKRVQVGAVVGCDLHGQPIGGKAENIGGTRGRMLQGVWGFQLHLVRTDRPWVGRKVEISLEEEILRDVWFPATIVDDPGNIRFLVEYKELQRIGIDHLHIRPSAPQCTVTSFDLLEKVDVFYDFGWWSGVVKKKLADSRYVVYFKHTNKVKD
ncbi:putative Agenet-like domain-containing protein [Helianthus anomalus]